ncbi:MAG: DUF2314 domain-containing protein [Pseudomonadota bacterium]
MKLVLNQGRSNDKPMGNKQTLAALLGVAFMASISPDPAFACEEVNPCSSGGMRDDHWVVAGCVLVAFLAYLAFVLRDTWLGLYPEVSAIDPNDPRIERAKQNALTSINEFWEHYNDPAHDEEDFALKVTLKTNEGHEHIWIGEISNRNGKLFGRIVNDPIAQELELGQMIQFDTEQICDWGYTKADQMRGNFSLAVMLSNLSEKKRSRALSDMGWTEADIDARLA